MAARLPSHRVSSNFGKTTQIFIKKIMAALKSKQYKHPHTVLLSNAHLTEFELWKVEFVTQGFSKNPPIISSKMVKIFVLFFFAYFASFTQLSGTGFNLILIYLQRHDWHLLVH